MLQQQLRHLRHQLQTLDGKRIEIRAEGVYLDKRSTPVNDVAHYQNDGTDRIKPAKFVERAARKAHHWSTSARRAIALYINDAEYSLRDLGLEISYDINVMIDRIKTGRLKKSMRPKIK